MIPAKIKRTWDKYSLLKRPFYGGKCIRSPLWNNDRTSLPQILQSIKYFYPSMRRCWSYVEWWNEIHIMKIGRLFKNIFIVYLNDKGFNLPLLICLWIEFLDFFYAIKYLHYNNYILYWMFAFLKIILQYTGYLLLWLFRR